MPVGGGGGANPFGDEMPVGGGSKNPFGPGSMPDELPPGAAAPAGGADDDKPLDERLVSKAWATRKTAFEELEGVLKKFDTCTSNEIMERHAPKWAKYLVEINPGALEKVLDCFAVYIDKCAPALLTTFHDKVIPPILDKCMGAAKANLK